MVSDETMQEGPNTNPEEELTKIQTKENDYIFIPKSYKYDSVLVWLHGEGQSSEFYHAMFLPI